MKEDASDIGKEFPARMRVSVIIPAFNAQDYIEEAIKSVLAQRYAPIEILVINDGSTDDTESLVKAFAPSVRLINQANAGVAAARNRGIREAKGDVLCFLDADDGWFPGKIEAQVAHLQHNSEVGLVYHHWLVVEPDDAGKYCIVAPSRHQVRDEVEEKGSGLLFSRLLLDSVIHTSTVMVRKSITEKVGYFDEQLINGEDYDYWIRISRLCRIDMLKGIFSFYRISVPGSLTQSPKPTNYEYMVVERALARWLDEEAIGPGVDTKALRKRMGKLAFDFGYQHYHFGSKSIAAKSFRNALKYENGNFKAWVYFLLSMFHRGTDEIIRRFRKIG